MLPPARFSARQANQRESRRDSAAAAPQEDNRKADGCNRAVALAAVSYRPLRLCANCRVGTSGEMMGILLGLVGMLVLVALFAMSTFNGLVGKRNRYKNAYAQIDVQ